MISADQKRIPYDYPEHITNEYIPEVYDERTMIDLYAQDLIDRGYPVPVDDPFKLATIIDKIRKNKDAATSN